MKVIIALYFLSVALTSRAQVNKLDHSCGGMDIVNVGVHIKGRKILDYNGIRYSEISVDSLRDGFTVSLSDTSHKVKWFLINYKDSIGIKEFPISDSLVSVNNAAFIKSIKPGDQLSLECINIQKAGVTKLSTNFKIIVTD